MPPIYTLRFRAAAVSVNVFLRKLVNDPRQFRTTRKDPGVTWPGRAWNKGRSREGSGHNRCIHTEHFQFDMFDAGSRSFTRLPCAGSDGLASALTRVMTAPMG